MKAIAAYIFMFSFVIIYSQDVGDFCTSKSISNRINDNDNFAQDVTLALATNMESNVRVLGKSCCSGAAGGILNIAGGTINNVTMEETEA